jgi:hypothetical protein
MMTGIVNNSIIYADSWDGHEKTMTIAKFVKKFVDPENAMLRICIDSYSHHFVNTVERQEPAAHPNLS